MFEQSNDISGRRPYTRRDLLTTGGIAAASSLLATSAKAAPRKSPASEPHDPTNPLVTIDINGVKATLIDKGISWVVDNITPFRVPMQDLLNGWLHIESFIAPDGTPYHVPIEFDGGSSLAAVVRAAGESTLAPRVDVFTTALAVYQVGKAFGVFSLTDRGFSRTRSQLLLDGAFTFSYVMAPGASASKKEKAVSGESYSLDVSNLLATPEVAPEGTGPKPVTAYKVRGIPSYLIPKEYWDDITLPIHKTISVTSDGENIHRTSLDVRALLNGTTDLSARRTAADALANHLGAGRGFSIGDVKDVLTIADWLLTRGPAFDLKAATRVTGSIGIGISMSF